MKYQSDIIINTYFGWSYIARSKQFKSLFMARIWAEYAATMVDLFFDTHPDNGISWGIKKIS